MVIKEKCRVTWCNNLRKKRSQVCEMHSQYKNICRAAIRLDRPHLMYKVEKWLKGKHQCERCGFDPTLSYPNLDLLGQSSMLDVDHILAEKEGGANHPDNVQTICKTCHRTKSMESGDFANSTDI